MSVAADARPLLEHRHDHARRAARQEAARGLDRPLRLRSQPTGIDFPGESPGIVLPVDRWSGLDDRERPDRPGNRGHADPDGGGVRERSRTRGVWVAAASRRPRRGRKPAASSSGAGSSRRRSRSSCWGCSRASSPRRARAKEAAVPGYWSRARPAPPQADPHGGYSDTNYVASFVGIVPASSPAARHPGLDRRAARADLRRPRRRAGFPRHRPVRAAVPGRAARRLRFAAKLGRHVNRLVPFGRPRASWCTQPPPRGEHSEAVPAGASVAVRKVPQFGHFGDLWAPRVAAGRLVRLARRGPGAADRRARAGGGRRAGPDRDTRPRLRRARRAARRSLLLRAGHAPSTVTTSRRRRSRTVRPRSSSSGRSTWRCRSSSSPTRARRWRSRPTSSSAGRRVDLAVAGVTGTNGKTTTAFLLYAVLAAAGRRPGLLGTIETQSRRRAATGDTDDRGGDRPPAPLPRDARRRRPELRDGGHLARLGAPPARPGALRGPRLHQPEPGSPRLPRRHGRLLRGQAAAVPRRGRTAGRGERRPTHTAAGSPKSCASGVRRCSRSDWPRTPRSDPRGSSSGRR